MNKIIVSSIVVVGAALAAAAAETAEQAVRPAPAASESNAAAPTVPAEAAAEINKAVVTHVKVSAKSRVDSDIDAWCRETGIVLGLVNGKNAFYIKGVERVTANAKDATFIKSRSLAYSKAYQNAVAEYILLKFGRTWSEQFNRVFTDASTGAPDTVAAKDAVDRIAEKTCQLAEVKLDEGLRKMGVAPTGSLASRRKLAQNLIIKKTIKSASGDSAGLLPVQTFEGWDENGKYAVGVVIRGGVDTEILAECLKNKCRPLLSRPEAGLTVEEALPNSEELVSQFGVRMFFDKSGTPALLSIGQWGSSYTGEDEDLAEEAMDHARDQAQDEADDFLTMFINSTLSMRSESDRGEETGRVVENYADGASVERAIKESVDRRFKESTMRGQDTMIGRATVGGFPKVIRHPAANRDIAVCARVWSFDQFDAMNRTVTRPKTEVKPQPEKPGKPGKNRGRTYDF